MSEVWQLQVPPAIHQVSARARMVGVVKSLSYTTACLLALVALMAAGEILQGLVVLSTILHISGATYWLVTELIFKHDDPFSGEAEPVPKEFDSLSVVFAAGAFFTLLLIYSLNVDNSKPYSPWDDYYLLAVCMISLCSTFISLLIKIVIFSYALDTRAWSKAEMILSFITYISLVLALFSTFILLIFGSFTSK